MTHPKPITACILGVLIGAASPAGAAIGVTNGNFETGAGNNVDNVTGWFDNSNGTFWQGTWQTNAAAVSPNNTGVAVLGSYESGAVQNTASPDVMAGNWLYQSIGTVDGGETELKVDFQFGQPDDDPGGRTLGVTVAVYAYNGTGTFVAGDNTDLRAASLDSSNTGVTLLDSESFQFGPTTAADQAPAGYSSTLDVSAAGGQTLFLRFNNYRPAATESWSVLDNVSAALLAATPVFTLQPLPYDGNVGDNVTLTASAAATPAPAYQWQFSEDGFDPWGDLAGETGASLVLDPAAFTDNGYYRVVASNGSSVTSDPVEVFLVYPAPVITTQPRNGTIHAGGNATFSVVATGLGSLSYQWYNYNTGMLVDGGDVSGATTATLSLANVSTADADDYYCEITDHAATEQSSGELDASAFTVDATLEVFETPAADLLAFEPFSAYPTGVILTGQNPAITGFVDGWLDEAFGDVPPRTSAGSLAYGGAGYVPGIGGKVGSVVDAAAIGAANSGRAARMLAPELKATGISSQTRYLSWLFRTGNEGTAPSGANNYQVIGLWNGASGNDALRVFEAGIALGDFGTANYGFRVGNNNATRFDLGVAPDTAVHLFVAKFVLDPATGADSVTVWIDPALGAGEPAGGTTVGGVDLVWDRLTISDYAGNSAQWDEIRWGATFDSVTVEAPEMPLIPEFTLQPADTDGVVGGAVTLEATAEGDPAPGYQWQFSESGADPWTDLGGETSPSLVIDPASHADNRFYRVIATNVNGSATSDDALLTIIYPDPVITQQPVSASAYAGTDVQFTVTATGLGNLTYQWFRVEAGGDIELSGETAASLDITGVSAADAGGYYVRISDDAAVPDEGNPTESFSATATLAVVDVVVTSSETAPATDSSDEYYLPGNVDDVDNIGGTGVSPLDNDGSTYVAFDRNSQGMTFTTGSDPLGYTVSSVTVRNVRLNNYLTDGTFYDIQNLDTFEFQFGTVSGGVKTPVFDTDSAQYNGAAMVNAAPPNNFGSGRYITFDLTAAGIGTLSPDTTYYFEISAENGAPYFEMSGTKADGYAGGTAFRGDTVATIDTTYVELAGDRAFHVDLTGLSGPSDDFASWIAGYPAVGGLAGFTDDADGDGLKNGLENYFGTDPSASNQGLVEIARSGNTITFRHPDAEPSADVGGSYVWSADLAGYHGDGESAGGTTVTFAVSAGTPAAGTTTVTATITGTVPAKLFVALKAELSAP